MNIRKILLILVLGGASTGLAETNAPSALAGTNGPAATAPSTAPKIDFSSVVFNFGRVKSGEIVKHDFVFTNSGRATLQILEVKPGCGCTTAGEWDKTVEPGKTGRIPLQFNSTGFGGQIGKSAFVTCNDPGRSNLVLQITGTVWKPIDVTPAMAMFTPSSEAPTNDTRVLHIVNNLDEPVTLSDLKSTSASFKTELKEVKPGKEFDLLITLVPPFTSSTLFSTVSFKTSSTNAPLVTISAYGMVQQAVMVTPQQLTLPVGPLKTPVTTAVMVRNNSTNDFTVSDVRLDVPGVELRVTEPQTGRLYSISMTFPAGLKFQSGERPELTFKSSHPRYPLLKVPVVQLQPVAAAPATAPGAEQLRPASPLLPASPVGRLPTPRPSANPSR